MKQNNDPVLTSQSNGSLMRAWPLVFFDSRDGIAILDCKLTNDNPVNIECNQIYVRILSQLLFGDFNIDQIRSSVTSDIIKEAIDDALLGRKRTFLPKQNGWVVHGLYFAVLAAVSICPIMEMYDRIIQMKIDPDTTATIAGAVFGAKYHSTFLEDPEITALLDVILKVDTNTGNCPRPDIYHPTVHSETPCS